MNTEFVIGVYLLIRYFTKVKYVTEKQYLLLLTKCIGPEYKCIGPEYNFIRPEYKFMYMFYHIQEESIFKDFLFIVYKC